MKRHVDELAGGCPAASHFSCLAKKSNQKKARPLHRPAGSQSSTHIQSGQKNSLRSNSFWPKPSGCALNFGGVEGCSTCGHRDLNDENCEIQTGVRNIHELFQAKMPEKSHGYCVEA
jgi:hypothetical protein